MDESLKAQLQATLNMIPAFTWYAAPSGALLFVNSRCADYLGLPHDHPLRFGTDTGAAWDSHIPLLHPDDHEETRRVWSDCLRTGRPAEVSFRVRDAKAITAGSSVARSLSERTTARSSIGWGSTSISKNASGPSRASGHRRHDSGHRVGGFGLTAPMLREQPIRGVLGHGAGTNSRVRVARSRPSR